LKKKQLAEDHNEQQFVNGCLKFKIGGPYL